MMVRLYFDADAGVTTNTFVLFAGENCRAVSPFA